jgi:hypothetical protein
VSHETIRAQKTCDSIDWVDDIWVQYRAAGDTWYVTTFYEMPDGRRTCSGADDSSFDKALEKSLTQAYKLSQADLVTRIIASVEDGEFPDDPSLQAECGLDPNGLYDEVHNLDTYDEKRAYIEARMEQ